MKKGVIGLSVLQWLTLRLPELIVSFIALFTIISAFTIADVDITDGEAEILSKRLLYNLYERDKFTGDAVVGVVDPLKLIAEYEPILLNSIKYPKDKFIAVKITLDFVGDEVIGYYSKHWYDRWKPIAEAKVKGEAAVAKSFTIPVTLSDRNAFEIAQKKNFLAQLPNDVDPEVITNTEKEIQDLKDQGHGGRAMALITFDVVKPKKK